MNANPTVSATQEQDESELIEYGTVRAETCGVPVPTPNFDGGGLWYMF